MTSSRGRLTRRLSDGARSVLGRRDATLPLLSFFPNLRASMIVGPDTEVCVEGYPRSANTFTHEALAIANPGLEIAHHVHQPAQITRAARFEVPCLVLVREPAAAIASHFVFNRGRSSLGRLTADYVNFYSQAHGPIASGAAAVCRFEQATASTRAASDLLNSRFGCELEHCTLSVEELRASLARFGGEPRGCAAVFGRLRVGETREDLEGRVRAQSGFGRAVEAFEATIAADPGQRLAASA